MKKILIYSLLPILLAACTSTRYASTDDVYSSGQSTYVRGEFTPQEDTRNESPAEYRDQSSYQTYEEEGYGYGAYSQRLRRFHDPSMSFDYYSPFSYGYPYGNSGFYGSMSLMWGNPYSYSYGSYPFGYRPMSLYEYHIHSFHRSFWDQWYSPFGYAPYGYIPYDAYSPWYNNYYYHPYHNGNSNVQRYYGPRNWSGSNTNDNV
ncbi:MAG TPA: hypothetical protein VEB42_02400, partial [Chitinophagaceae bacterium]|nr:hypothetical protein [Chitinophagaceae bacterium]